MFSHVYITNLLCFLGANNFRSRQIKKGASYFRKDIHKFEKICKC